MKPQIILIFVAALAISTLASYLSGRFLRGFLLPIACFLAVLLFISAHYGGWEFDGFVTVLAYALALLLLLGIPVVLISAVGAFVGVALSKKARDVRDSESG